MLTNTHGLHHQSAVLILSGWSKSPATSLHNPGEFKCLQVEFSCQLCIGVYQVKIVFESQRFFQHLPSPHPCPHFSHLMHHEMI